MDRPLEGRRVLVTRAAHQAGKLSDGLRALGAIPVEVPVLDIRPPEDPAALDAALKQIHLYDWILFTSANTVRALADRAAFLGVKFETHTGKIAAVGEATAAAARHAGLQVHFVPDEYVAESLLAGFPEDVAGKRILLARAAKARDVVPDALLAAGAHLQLVEAYRNVLPENAAEKLKTALAQPIDCATFTSSSAVTHLALAAGQADIPFPLAGVPAVSIGPITSQTLREYHWEPEAEADPHDVPGLIAAVVATLAAKGWQQLERE